MYKGIRRQLLEPSNDRIGRGQLFVLTGPSGSGKDSAIAALLERDQTLRRVTTAVTRSPRQGERAGIDHFFLSEDEFDRWLADGAFLEWASVFGFRYGTPRAEVDRLLEFGFNVILRIDPQGAAVVRQQRPGTPVIYVGAENEEELLRRLRERGENEQSLRRRRRTWAADAKFARTCEYQVINRRGRLDDTVDQLAAIVEGADASRRASGRVAPECDDD